MKGALSTLLVAAALVVASAVGALAVGPGVLSGHVVTSWTTSDGASIGPVMAFAQDSDGYLWLGTTAGVVRFDGARFTGWDAISETPLPRVSVFALTIAKNGTLWIGFDGIGVRGYAIARSSFLMRGHLHVGGSRLSWKIATARYGRSARRASTACAISSGKRLAARRYPLTTSIRSRNCPQTNCGSAQGVARFGYASPVVSSSAWLLGRLVG